MVCQGLLLAMCLEVTLSNIRDTIMVPDIEPRLALYKIDVLLHSISPKPGLYTLILIRTLSCAVFIQQKKRSFLTLGTE